MTYKFIVTTNHNASEIVSDAMFELGASGVCIVDPEDFDEIDKNGVVWDYITEDDKKGAVTVEGFFDAEDPDEFLHNLNEKLDFIQKTFPFPEGTFSASYEQVPEVDWLQEWKKYYKPIILDKISIIPSWCEPVGEKYIFIEPGQAFGTGEHESTNMCLRLSFNIDLLDKKVADVGCGSGIIGMCAMKLGAKSCYFTDLDGEALENLKVNLSLNGITENVEVVKDSLLDHNQENYDVIFANITADILELLAPTLDKHLSDGGKVIVSGIIAEREKEVLDCYENAGFVVVDKLALNDWRAFTFVRKNGN